MNIIVCENYDKMSQKACDLITKTLKNNPKGLYSFPGGDTPLGMFRAFTKAVNAGEVDISQANYVSLDEWIGMRITDEGSCGHFNQVNLLDSLEKQFKNTHIIDGAADSPEAEKEKLNSFINQYGPLEVSVLGIGLNGHLGFNEEGVDFSSDAHIIPLAETTKKVMTKYFGNKFSPEYGITQGISQIMNAKTVILLANGVKKAEIIKKALKHPVTNEIPATVLQNHPNVYFIIDKEAASLL